MIEDSRQSRRRGRIGKTVKGKWRIDGRLGDGATATVYSATHRNGHRVALKVMHKQFLRDEQIRKRFLREAYVANAVEHPGMVRVLDDDIAEDGAVFLVMELLEGESLEKRAERHGGRLPWGEVVWLLDQLLDILAAAHDKSVIHRDIKPDNIFFTNSGQVKVLDFGFARMKEEASLSSSPEETLTKTGFILGTPDFMSPEQAGGRNSAVDSRSDLWAAGASAFYLISGQRVHAGTQTLHQHLVQTATKRARSLGAAAPDVPPGVVEVIDRALSLEQDRRFPDARAMRKALQDAIKKLGSNVSAPEIEDADSTVAYSRRQPKPGPAYDDGLDTVAEADPLARLAAAPPDTATDVTRGQSPKYVFEDESVVFVGDRSEAPTIDLDTDTQEEMPTTLQAFSPVHDDGARTNPAPPPHPHAAPQPEPELSGIPRAPADPAGLAAGADLAAVRRGPRARSPLRARLVEPGAEAAARAARPGAQVPRFVDDPRSQRRALAGHHGGDGHPLGHLDREHGPPASGPPAPPRGADHEHDRPGLGPREQHGALTRAGAAATSRPTFSSAVDR